MSEINTPMLEFVKQSKAAVKDLAPVAGIYADRSE